VSRLATIKRRAHVIVERIGIDVNCLVIAAIVATFVTIWVISTSIAHSKSFFLCETECTDLFISSSPGFWRASFFRIPSSKVVVLAAASEIEPKGGDWAVLSQALRSCDAQLYLISSSFLLVREYCEMDTIFTRTRKEKCNTRLLDYRFLDEVR
jgi:ABC-type dipeptide/oligopeptide/nickel transport system permease component